MSYGHRLKEAIKLAKTTRKALAQHLEVSPQAVGQIINSQTAMLTALNSALAARFLSVDHHWLATGEGEARPRDVMSPLALALAHQFDARVPLQLRDRTYAQAQGLVELAANASPDPKVVPAAEAKPALRRD